jgi:predicted ATPase/class 3 adenylate cyclase
MAAGSRLAFGALLKRSRRAARLTQAQLAERAGFSVTYISKLECGARVPQPTTVALLADALSVPPAERATLETALRRPADQRLLARPPSPFGELLRRQRVAAGLTQEELAERAGLSRRGIADLESGARRRPRRDTVALLSTALGVSEAESVRFESAARGDAERQLAAQSESQSDSSALPSGTVTFLFSDLEGSTRLLQQLGSTRYAALRDAHHQLLRAACTAHGGREVDTAGDSFFVAFPTAGEAVAAAAEAQRAIAVYLWPDGATVRDRMGLHTGTAQVSGDHYIGLEVHRAARIGAAGHGGQVLLSQTTRDLALDTLPEGAQLVDLGAYRLKDLQRPESLWQLVVSDVPGLPAEFPPLRSLEVFPHNLPIQPTPLLGREREVQAVGTLLCRDEVRLVTLTGTGGTGKTRLALQVAAEVVDRFADGVWFVGLSRLVDPNLVLPTIAQTLGVREAGGQPIAALLAAYLHAKQVVLLLDNFEQVVTAAPAVAALLQTCAGVKVLVTSRMALRLRGEKQVQVPPLPLPTPAQLALTQDLVRYGAVALFVQRAQDADADFALTKATVLAIAAVCARLDGLPLAIELAAAKVPVLPPPALLARLERQLPLLTGGPRDLEARQQTMRATLAWSEELLSPAEQRLFRRLAVFVGGFTLAAAEAVCAAPDGAEPLGLEVVDGLGALVDQSLVQRSSVGQDRADDEERGGEVRFRLQYVIREYAIERLEAGEEAEALRRAHAAYYLRLAEQVQPKLEGADQVEGVRRVEREYDNLRAAVGWLRNHGEVAQGLRLAIALHEYFDTRSLMSEGRTWLEGLLALLPPREELEGPPSRSGQTDGTQTAMEVPAWVQARARCYVGGQAANQRDFGAATVQLQEGLALGRAAGDGWAVWTGLYWLSELARSQGKSEQASPLAEELLAVARDLGEPALIGEALWENGAVANDRGDLDQAAAHFEEVLARFAAQIQPHLKARTLLCLSTIALKQGDPARASALLREPLMINQSLDNHYGIGGVLENLAWVSAQMSPSRRSARLLGAAAALFEAMEWTSRRPHVHEEVEAGVAPARAALGEAEWAAAFAEGRALSKEEAITEALSAVESVEARTKGLALISQLGDTSLQT